MDNRLIFIDNANRLIPDAERYTLCMDNIKNRWKYIEKIINEPMSKADIETVALNFRMICELIFYANLSSYEGILFLTNHELAGLWKTHEIIDKIKNINPDYFPTIVKLSPIEKKNEKRGDTYITIGQNILEENDLLEIYEKCSEVLHAQNPFAKPQTYDIIDMFDIWHLKIKQQLMTHRVKLAAKDPQFLLTQINFDSPYGTQYDIQVGYLAEKIK